MLTHLLIYSGQNIYNQDILLRIRALNDKERKQYQTKTRRFAILEEQNRKKSLVFSKLFLLNKGIWIQVSIYLKLIFKFDLYI